MGEEQEKEEEGSESVRRLKEVLKWSPEAVYAGDRMRTEAEEHALIWAAIRDLRKRVGWRSPYTGESE